MHYGHASGEEGEMRAWKLLAVALYICKLQPSVRSIEAPTFSGYMSYDYYDMESNIWPCRALAKGYPCLSN